jgi:hypothetical protein
MKNNSKFGLLGSIMLLAVSPFALAETPDPAVCEAAPEVVVTEPVDETTTTDGDDGASVVPTDWVKRGGGDNPEIYQNLVSGEAPVFKPEISSVSKELGQTEKAADIESKEITASPAIVRVKKGPVALLKKGRVFLR